MKTTTVQGARRPTRKVVVLVCSFVVTAPLALGQDSDEGPPPAERFLRALEPGPDCDVVLVAAEPLVVDPVAMAWDAVGRPWVVTANGGLSILEDDDADGRMDRAQAFAEDLAPFQAFVFHRNGVILAQGTQLVFLDDADADDRADARHVLFDGLQGARVTSLARGLDGWIYAALGLPEDIERSVKDASGEELATAENGVVRFLPDGSAFELHSVVVGEIVGLDVGWDGEVFYLLATGELRHVVLPEALLRHTRIADGQGWAAVLRPLEKDSLLSGPLIHPGSGWPETYYGNHIVCRPEEGFVARDALRPRGVSYTAAASARLERLLASDQPWFRPVSTSIGPDGALYVVDACAPGSGRLWRVANRSAAPLPRIALRGIATETLIGVLEHPGGWQLATAVRLFAERELTSQQLDTIVRLAKNTLDPRARIHSLWVLREAAPARMEELAETLVADYRPTVRAASLAAAATLDRWQVLRLRHRIEGRLDDASPRVRFVAIRALPGTSGKSMVNRLTLLYARAGEDWTRGAVMAHAVDSPVRFLQSAFELNDERLLRMTVHLALYIGRNGDVEGAVGVLMAAGENRTRAPAMVAQVLIALGQSLDPELRPWASPRVSGTLRRLLRTESVEVALAALPFAIRWIETGELRPDAADLVTRSAALAVHAETPPATRRACLFAFASLAGERDEVLVPLSLRPTWMAVLIDGVERGELAASELGPEARERLRNHPDPDVARRAKELLAD